MNPYHYMNTILPFEILLKLLFIHELVLKDIYSIALGAMAVSGG